MKKFWCVCVIVLLLVACTDDGKIRVKECVHYDSSEESSIEGRPYILEYDSVVFSDGSYATYQLHYAPQNSLYEFFDKTGRVIATLAQASECYEQAIIYKYDKRGRLTNLLSFWGGFDETAHYMDWYGDSTTIDYETFRNQIELVDFARPDTARFQYISIEYDGKDNAIRANNVNTGKVIEAPEGYMLDILVKQCPNFWSSDLGGGQYIFKVCVKPKNASLKDYTLFRYADFLPVLEENYKNGVLVRAVVYPNKAYHDCRTWTKTFSIRNGEDIYTCFYTDEGDTLRSVWRNHYLVSRQTVSRYGTILEQYTYLYELPSSQVKVVHEKLDFKSMKMKNVSESFTTLSEIDSEENEMKLLKDDGCWYNVYTAEELYKDW